MSSWTSRLARLTSVGCLSFLIVGGVVATVPSALATDYYVRTDGNDANNGRSNSPSGAWRSVTKCIRSVGAGDRCLIGDGTYTEGEGPISLTDEGRLTANDVATCTCTEGATTISCSSDVSSRVDAGDHVSCDGSPYYGWTRVEGVSGSTITLSDPYVGESETNGALDVASMVVIQGIGSSRDSVVVTSWVDQPGGITWAKESGLSCVYSYRRSDASGVWAAPESLREKVPDSQWDWHDANDNGADPYIRIKSAGSAPCPSSTVQQNVDQARRSWGMDSSKVYVRTEDCSSPAGRAMQAGYGGSSEDIFLDLRGDYVVVRDLRIEASRPFDAPVLRDPLSYAMLVGESDGMDSVRLSNLLIATGRLQYASGSSNRKTLVQDVLSIGSSDMPDGTWSGLIIEGHFARGAQWSVDAFKGTSENDRIILRRNRIGRTFSRTDTGQFDCSLGDFPPSQYYRGGHGLYIGSTALNRDHSHLVIENSIFEMTFDGLQVAGNGSTRDVIIRNNTFGLSKSASLRGNQKALHGTSASAGARISYYNNLILGAFDMGGAQNSQGWINPYASSNVEGISSNFNLYVFTGRPGGFGGACPRVWGSGQNFDTVQESYGQELNSILVCSSGCSCSRGTVFNDGAGQHGVVDFETADGDGTDYTQDGGDRAANRGVDAGSNAHCPLEDFYGNKRTDGRCDIGAVERTGSAPDTTPPNPVSGLDAAPGNAMNTISWFQSSSSDTQGARAVFRMDRYPTSPADGEFVCDIEGAPGSEASCEHQGLTNGQEYHYSVFAYDRSGNEADPGQDSATPSEPVSSGPENVENARRTDVK